MIVFDALRAAALEFQQAGIPTPMVDARLLMAFVLDTEPTQLFLLGDREAPEEFHKLVARRVTREPLQHITGVAWFYGLPMLSEPGAFIPRPETELLVEWAVGHARSTGARRILDLCTGSGTIALAISSQLDATVSVTGVDIDGTALDLAHRNLQQLRDKGLLGKQTGEVTFIQADLSELDVIQRLGLEDSFDLVISNPPYVPEGRVSPEVEADPHHAVFSGADGMELMPRILEAAYAAGKDGAGVGIEHDDTTGEATMALMNGCDHGQFTDVQQHYDLAERPRFLTGRVATRKI